MRIKFDFFFKLITYRSWVLTTLGWTASEKNCGKKEENAGNQHYLLFPQFDKYNVWVAFNLSSANTFNLDQSKNCVGVPRGLLVKFLTRNPVGPWVRAALDLMGLFCWSFLGQDTSG